MTTKRMTQEHNVETGEVIVREMTDAEIAQYEKDLQSGVQRQQAREAAEAAKEAAHAKLAALGLTTDDLKALGL